MLYVETDFLYNLTKYCIIYVEFYDILSNFDSSLSLYLNI